MDRPADLFDRVQEWDDLSAFSVDDSPGTRLALVRGRRRQGKSFLLRRLADATGGFYYQAVEEERHQALTGFGAALGQHADVPGGRIALTSWDAAIAALDDLAASGRRLVVIDEFPYLLAHSPELPSLLQRAIDRSRDGGNALRLVLCGSALAVMARLLTGAQALRGRAHVDVVVRTFDYRLAADYWGVTDPRTAFLVHSVLGGTPGYRDLLTSRPLRRASDLGRWLADGALNPASALFREDEYLLTEDRSLTDRALYHSVVSAIANGNTSQGAIASALARDARAVQHPLRALEEAGLVTRTDDTLRSRRPFYRVVDPIVRFHHVVTRPDVARFEDRRTLEAWADAQPRFSTHVLGPHFEELAREFTFRFADSATVGGAPARVGSAIVNDAGARTQHEIGVVALGRDAGGGSEVLAIGEAKHTNAKRTPTDVTRLERVRALVADKHPSAATAKLLLFSAQGFDRALEAAAVQRSDLELVDLERLYHGA
jgi:DNA-binding transcriptional ArsR family regulator